MEAISAGKGMARSWARSVRLAFAWCLQTIRVRFQKCRLGRAERKMNERMARLGTEIYSLYRQGDSEFLKSLVVRQQLKIVEEAERRVFEVYDSIEAIEASYRMKVEEAGPGE